MKNIVLKDPVLECDWQNLLGFINSSAGKDHAKSINFNMSRAPYPLTSGKLNDYYLKTSYGLKSVYKRFNCAADMYSYFLNSFEGKESSAWNPGASGANPVFGVAQTKIDLSGILDFIKKYGLPIALIIFGVVLVNKALD